MRIADPDPAACELVPKAKICYDPIMRIKMFSDLAEIKTTSSLPNSKNLLL
jgi:hypothetical protein